MNTVASPYTGPFDLANESAYLAWRRWKLAACPRTAKDLLVEVRDPYRLAAAEQAAILDHCRRCNMVLYQFEGSEAAEKSAIRALGKQLGLESLDMNLRADEDSISTIRVKPDSGGTHFIPYTNRPLNWHTDGYYNPPQEQVRAIVMHCVADADQGGDNLLLDPEIAYIHLRDDNPQWVHALMQADAMTIPANGEQGADYRPAQTGPVFSVEKTTGALHMRYTARTRSIEWKQDDSTQQAVARLGELLAAGVPGLVRHHLQAGQGIICNNVLHKREAFTDGDAHRRILYRARYHERVHDTVAAPELYGE